MPESQHLEYKRELSDSLEKEVIAFLNHRDGGQIHLGIDDAGQVVGLADPDGDQLKIKDRLKQNIQPSCLGLFDVLLEESPAGTWIRLIVASGSEKPYYLRKQGMSPRGCFIRIGSAAEPMPERMIEQRFATRTRNSIGRIRAPRQDLSFALLKIYYEAIERPLGDKFASNLELTTEDGDYNYAAYLLADHNNTSIKVARYAGTDRVDLIESEEFFEGYSMPRNKELMRIFRDLEMVEYLGSGIPRILQAYTKQAFRFTENFTRMCFPSAEKTSGKTSGNGSTPQAPPQATPQATPQVTPQVNELLSVLSAPLSMAEILKALGKSDRENLRKNQLKTALELRLIELTIPEKPKSPKQKYRLTRRGIAALRKSQ